MIDKRNISPDQQAWLAEVVARGDYASEEEAMRAAFSLGVLQLDYEGGEETDEEITQIKGLLDEARAQVARGEFYTLEETLARMDQRQAARRAR